MYRLLALTIALSVTPASANPKNSVATDVVCLALPTDTADGLTAESALKKLADGQAELVTQASIRTLAGQRTKIDFHRTHKFAKTMTRRGDTTALPKRCAVFPVGTQLVVEPDINEGGKTIDLRLDFRNARGGAKRHATSGSSRRDGEEGR